MANILQDLNLKQLYHQNRAGDLNDQQQDTQQSTELGQDGHHVLFKPSLKPKGYHTQAVTKYKGQFVEREDHDKENSLIVEPPKILGISSNISDR